MWPVHTNGKQKKLSEMTKEERCKIARESFEKDFKDIPADYLATFDATFDRIFGVK